MYSFTLLKVSAFNFFVLIFPTRYFAKLLKTGVVAILLLKLL